MTQTDFKASEDRRTAIRVVVLKLLGGEGELMKRVMFVSWLSDEMNVEFKSKKKEYHIQLREILDRIDQADNLQLIRKEIGYTVEEMSDILGIPWNWLEQMERGTRRLNKKVYKFVYGEDK